MIFGTSIKVFGMAEKRVEFVVERKCF